MCKAAQEVNRQPRFKPVLSHLATPPDGLEVHLRVSGSTLGAMPPGEGCAADLEGGSLADGNCRRPGAGRHGGGGGQLGESGPK